MRVHYETKSVLYVHITHIHAKCFVCLQPSRIIARKNGTQLLFHGAQRGRDEVHHSRVDEKKKKDFS